MAGLALSTAQQVAVILESVFYGGFLVMFVTTISTLFISRKNRKVQYDVVTEFIMVVLTSAHLAVNASRIMEGFSPDMSGSVQDYFTVETPKETGKIALYAMQFLVSGFYMVHRVYVTWDHNFWVLLLPLVLLFCAAATGLGMAFEVANGSPVRTPLQAALFPWTFLLPTAFNAAMMVVCTLFISGRIWYAYPENLRRGGPVLRGYALALAIVIESGVLYSVALVVVLVVYLVNSNYQYPAMDLTTPLSGVVVSTIIIRVHRNSIEKSSELIPLHPNRPYHRLSPDIVVSYNALENGPQDESVVERNAPSLTIDTQIYHSHHSPSAVGPDSDPEYGPALASSTIERRSYLFSLTSGGDLGTQPTSYFPHSDDIYSQTDDMESRGTLLPSRGNPPSDIHNGLEPSLSFSAASFRSPAVVKTSASASATTRIQQDFRQTFPPAYESVPTRDY